MPLFSARREILRTIHVSREEPPSGASLPFAARTSGKHSFWEMCVGLCSPTTRDEPGYPAGPDPLTTKTVSDYHMSSEEYNTVYSLDLHR